MNKLTLRQKIGQMISAGFPSDAVDEQAIALVKELEIGNFILFSRNFSTLSRACELTRGLRRLTMDACGVPPFILLDQEGGAVSRLRMGAALHPGAMALSAANPLAARTVGLNSGRILHALGMNTNCAPVVDVNNNPLNPVIGTRSFGDDPARVAQMGCDIIAGYRAGGVLAMAKHFPGHGNVAVDSHQGLPHVSASQSELETCEWLPYRAAIAHGLDAVMTAHIIFDQIDPQRPATLSPAILSGILREKMGFAGLIFTDCLEMNAISETYGVGEGAVLAVEAGADMVTVSHRLDRAKMAAESLYQAVISGRIAEARIDESVARIAAMKEKYHMQEGASDEALARRLVEDPVTRTYHEALSCRSITRVRGAYIPLAGKRCAFVSASSQAQTIAEDKGEKRTCFALDAQAEFGGEAFLIPADGTLPALDASRYDVLVIGLTNARLHPEQVTALRMLEKAGKPMIVVMLGAPYDETVVRRADCLIAAYEYTYLSVRAVVNALRTGCFPGTLPVCLA